MPSRRLGDKAWSRAWASGSPRPQHVWRPPHRNRRRLGTNGVGRTPTGAPRTPVAGCGEGRQKGRGPGGSRARACGKSKRGGKSTAVRPDSLFAREIYRMTHLQRVRARGEEERRQRTDLELRFAAPLLVPTSQPPLSREPALLHLRLSIRPCRGSRPCIVARCCCSPHLLV